MVSNMYIEHVCVTLSAPFAPSEHESTAKL